MLCSHVENTESEIPKWRAIARFSFPGSRFEYNIDKVPKEVISMLIHEGGSELEYLVAKALINSSSLLEYSCPILVMLFACLIGFLKILGFGNSAYLVAILFEILH